MTTIDYQYLIMKNLFFTGLLFLTVNCSPPHPGTNSVNKPLILQYAPALSIKIDSSISFGDLSNFFAFEKGNKEISIQKSNRTIYLFDLDKGEVDQTQKIPSEGPNKIKQLTQFDALTQKGNSYYLFHHFDGNIYEIKQESGENIVQNTLDNDLLGLKTFWGAPYSPPLLFEEEIYVPLYNDSRMYLQNTMAFARFNTEDNSYQELIPYPKKYDEGHWGDHPYVYIANMQYISSENLFYVSFPLSHDILIYDTDFNLVGKKRIQSNHLPYIKPLRTRKLANEVEIDHQVDREYFENLSYYLGAFYDPVNSWYIRIVRKVEVVEKGQRLTKYFMIICDQNLNIIGEVQLEDSYNIFKSFATKSYGLLLFNESNYTNENNLRYDTFDIKFD